MLTYLSTYWTLFDHLVDYNSTSLIHSCPLCKDTQIQHLKILPIHDPSPSTLSSEYIIQYAFPTSCVTHTTLLQHKAPYTIWMLWAAQHQWPDKARARALNQFKLVQVISTCLGQCATTMPTLSKKGSNWTFKLLATCNQLSGVVIGWTDVSSGTGHCWDHVLTRAVLIDWCLCCCV